MNGTIGKRASASQRDLTTHVSQRCGQSPSSIGWVRPPAGHSPSIARTLLRNRARRLLPTGVHAPTSCVDARPTLGFGGYSTDKGVPERTRVPGRQPGTTQTRPLQETYDRPNVEVHPSKCPGHPSRRGSRQHRHVRSVEDRGQRTLDNDVSDVSRRSGGHALRRRRGRHHHGGRRTRVVRRCRSRSGSSESEPSACVGLTASGWSANPSPRRTRRPTRQPSTPRIHNGNEARLPGHMAKGTLKPPVSLDKRCPGKSVGSNPLQGRYSVSYRHGVPFASPKERRHLPRSAISGCPSPLGALRRRNTSTARRRASSSRLPWSGRHPAFSVRDSRRPTGSDGARRHLQAGGHWAREPTRGYSLGADRVAPVRSCSRRPSTGDRGRRSAGVKSKRPAVRVPIAARCPS